MDFLAGLNDRQREAVLHTEGPLLIMAGAGSGKTKVVTHKIAYLIEEKNIYPGNILAITFTNKAAAEMKTRVADLLNIEVDHMWMGTFHSICVRILRRDIDKIGYDRSFTIYDRADQITLIKECIKEVNIDKDMYKESSLLARISDLKDKQVDPDTYINNNYKDFRERNVGEIYALYQKKLKFYNALDFDDLLIKAVELLEQNPEILDYYQKKFKYIFVDEYQDTNKIQYKFVKLLSKWHGNVCVVGDSDQCIVEGMKVNTPSGEVRIEDLKIGDTVYSAAGQSKVAEGTIDFVKKSQYKGPIINIQTMSGKTLKLTPNHILFSKLNPEPGVHYVYLMYKKELGYRIGQTQGVRLYEREKILNGLEVRMNQEHGDKAWILKVCTSKEEVNYYEMLYSLKYRIPTLVFHPKGRNITFDQNLINRFFNEIDTRNNVIELMDDLMIFEEYPVVRQGAIIRKDTFRRVVNLTFFGGRIVGNNAGWYSHRINFNTSGDDLKEKASSLNFNTRKGRRNTWRIETERTNYDEAERFSNEIIALEDGLEINRRARLLENTVFNFTPASHIKPTMSIAIFNNGEIIEDVVKHVDIENYEGFVYDISVPNLRQYVCEGIVVHNSIYSWRGADISNILDFEKDFPGAKVILLEQNYRSTQSILNVANQVIKKNNERKDKNLWTDNDDGDTVIYESCEYSEEEAFFVAKKIHEFIYKGYKPSDIAILYRTNVQSRTFEEVFMTEHLPYKIVGGLKFYDRKEVKDLIAYLKFLQNPNDNISLKRIINTPKRGIGASTINKIEEFAANTGDSIYGVILSVEDIPGLSGRAINSIKPFVELMNRFMAMKEIMGIKDFVEEVINSSGYIAELEKEDTIESRTRIENIKDFLSVALTFEEKNEGANMEDFLASISLLSDVDKTVETDNLITLMTVHSAKGLEYPIVFLVGMEEGLFPISRSFDSESDLEEERRLCYVAVTRAEKHLIITNAQRRTIYGNTNYTMPSRFIDEMGDTIERKITKKIINNIRKEMESNPEEKLLNIVDYNKSNFVGPKIIRNENKNLDIDVGTKVKHKKWGTGIVAMVKEREDGDKELTIAFDKEGLKKLLQSIAPIEIVKEG